MGHATPFAQVLSAQLGIPFEKISLLQGDSDKLIAGGGSGGSKSIMHTGTAIVEAAAKIIEKGKELAGYVLEAAPSDIEFDQGNFVIVGTDRAISIMDLASKLHNGLEAAGGRAAIARRRPCQRRAGRLDLSQRLPHRRSRGRSRDRHRRRRQLRLRQRFRHRHQSDDRRGPAPRRRRAGHRPGADGAYGLRQATASC